MEMKKQAGENANQKMVRLLARLNKELIEDGSADAISVRFGADGSGSLVLTRESGSTQKIYGFDALEQLVKYLECSPLNRLVASVTWAEIHLS